MALRGNVPISKTRLDHPDSGHRSRCHRLWGLQQVGRRGTTQDRSRHEKSNLPLRVDQNTTLVDVKYDRTQSTYWYVIENADQFDPQEMSALPSKADMFRHDRDVGLCHDDSGFYVAPIGQLTCMTAIMTAICVGCELAPAVCPA